MNTNFDNARFTVTYSRNCDGGVQEMAAAAKCIRDVFPNSQIVSERTNSFPIKVIISVQDERDGDKKIVWSGKQQNLFEKYQSKRTKCMQRIKSKLVDLQKQQADSTTTKDNNTAQEQRQTIPTTRRTSLSSPTITSERRASVASLVALPVHA
ncbi:expressed unknown protein [Seminavis robusta]|uniref:Uncharacterized protein n=1 Tax=Seminavis robusta TaxID=568900 RepID=A0A9N8EY10_9STRA|nr:expressed unknown protein [Seminavis robusta]|eukprot:Sro2472_g328660.1 n/a (153) ;mRNA; r:6877-7335